MVSGTANLLHKRQTLRVTRAELCELLCVHRATYGSTCVMNSEERLTSSLVLGPIKAIQSTRFETLFAEKHFLGRSAFRQGRAALKSIGSPRAMCAAVSRSWRRTSWKQLKSQCPHLLPILTARENRLHPHANAHTVN